MVRPAGTAHNSSSHQADTAPRQSEQMDLTRSNVFSSNLLPCLPQREGQEDGVPLQVSTLSSSSCSLLPIFLVEQEEQETGDCLEDFWSRGPLGRQVDSMQRTLTLPWSSLPGEEEQERGQINASREATDSWENSACDLWHQERNRTREDTMQEQEEISFEETEVFSPDESAREGEEEEKMGLMEEDITIELEETEVWDQDMEQEEAILGEETLCYSPTKYHMEKHGFDWAEL